MWQKAHNERAGYATAQAANGSAGSDFRFTRREAPAYCEGLSLGGHDDRRVPHRTRGSRRATRLDPLFASETPVSLFPAALCCSRILEGSFSLGPGVHPPEALSTDDAFVAWLLTEHAARGVSYGFTETP